MISNIQSQQKVIGIPTEPQSSIVRVIGYLCRQRLRLSSHPSRLLLPPCSRQVRGSMYELFVRFVGFPLGSLRVLWNEHRLDKLVQFIQIEVGEDGTDN